MIHTHLWNMTEIDYNAPAGVYEWKTASRGFKRGRGLAFTRFLTLADAIKYVMEDLTEGSDCASIEVDGCDLDRAAIKQLYESEDYPMKRR
jgi:hypothetical protein